MRISRAVAAAAAVWFVGSILVVFVRQWFAGIEPLAVLTGQVLWVAGPRLVIGFAMVALAARAYGRRAHWSGRAFAAAVLAVPAADIVLTVVLGLLGDGHPAVVAARAAAVLAGGALGWLLVRRFRPGA
ncbi:hypothetical protein CLV63_12751 [Murinocardiopsis flavida]|uniref:Uncharacterized protein n=1 Tax=Murinocardiopsis flavida TaxID=645275 RepID=A0A2P8CW26_9ACTN|nr:hypothetical protein [Murinocardiopsis flavida]PSK89178.1 hypothetical protein CLV63_12751 [Murinocardiopsis flavida]